MLQQAHVPPKPNGSPEGEAGKMGSVFGAYGPYPRPDPLPAGSVVYTVAREIS